MKTFSTATFTLMLKEPDRLVLRDFSKLFSALNNLYNYFSVLSVPEMRERLEAKLRKKEPEKVSDLLYSSALERIIGRQNRMNIVSLSKASPTVVKVEGVSEPMAALTSLLVLLLPGFEVLRRTEEFKAKLRVSEMRAGLEGAEEIATRHPQLLQDYISILGQIEGMDIPDEAKTIILGGIHRNLRSLEINQVKPMVERS